MISLKYILIRDDDISFFTNIDHINLLYNKLIEEKLPFNLAVIPSVSADIEIGNKNIYYIKEGLQYEPFIPPEYRGIKKTYSIGENIKLVNYINNIKYCEIIQHGFNHKTVNKKEEFNIRDKKEIRRKLLEGREIIKEFFSNYPSFFIPPWDNLSRESISEIKKYYKGTSLGRIYFNNLPIKKWHLFAQKLLYKKDYVKIKDFLILQHPGYLINRFKEPQFAYKRFVQILEQKKNTCFS